MKNMPKSLLIATLSVTLLTVSAFTVYADDPETKGKFGNRDAMHEAVENGDYDQWLEVAGEPITEVIDTEEKFYQFVEAHNLIQDGNFDEAQVIFDELGIKHPRRDGAMKKNMQAMREVLENEDYDAFLETAGERVLEIIDSEEKFNQMVEAHNLMQDGNIEEARAIMEELGLPGRGEIKEKIRAHMEAMKAALDAEDYSAWQEAAPERAKEIIDTQEEFDRLIEAHNHMEEGNFESAREIFEELGLKRGSGEGNRGEGMRTGNGNGEQNGVTE